MKLVNRGVHTWVYSRDNADSQNVKIAAAIGARFVSSAEHSPAELAQLVGNISRRIESEMLDGNSASLPALCRELEEGFQQTVANLKELA